MAVLSSLEIALSTRFKAVSIQSRVCSDFSASLFAFELEPELEPEDLEPEDLEPPLAFPLVELLEPYVGLREGVPRLKAVPSAKALPRPPPLVT